MPGVSMHAEVAWFPPKIVFQPRLPPSAGRKAEGGKRCEGATQRERQPTVASVSGKPLFSVVTIALNNAGRIRRTIESVLSQTYPTLEYVIVDGGSSDGTVETIRQFDGRVDYWVSEPDQGISDAFNKGISLCSGEWIGLLNAGDWYERNAVETMASSASPDVDFLYGACAYHTTTGGVTRRAPDRCYRWKLPFYMPQIHHPSVFVKRSVYDAHGGFDPGLRCAMDYDFLLRIHKAGRVGRAHPAHIVNMPVDGVSVRNYPQARDEVMSVSIRHGLPRVVASAIRFGFMGLYAIRQGLQRP